jgi:hypothetical protein
MVPGTLTIRFNAGVTAWLTTGAGDRLTDKTDEVIGALEGWNTPSAGAGNEVTPLAVNVVTGRVAGNTEATVRPLGLLFTEGCPKLAMPVVKETPLCTNGLKNVALPV